MKIMSSMLLAISLASGLIVCASTAVSAQTAPSGSTIFQQRCASCHAISADKPAKLGPNLAGVKARKAGSTSYAYSPAMKKAGLNWTEANLERFLAGPAKLVPGTKMMVSLTDPKQRAAVIAYLLKSN